jgi:hypothetical protein
VHDEKTLKRIGRSSATLFSRRRNLVNRRVESVEFPATSRGSVRRRMSIDFVLPDEHEIAPVWGTGSDSVYYLPLSVFKKWPPMRKLDLLDANGNPSPFLTRTQNGVTDGALLRQLALDALEAEDEWPLDPHLGRQLERIPQARAVIAEAIWNELFHAEPKNLRLTYDRQRKILHSNDYFLDVVGGLVENTILWMRVTGTPGSRQITKFAYDAPINLRGLRGFTPQSMGWQPLNFALEVPHLGASGSYHLQFDIPSQLRVTDARLEVVSHDLPDEAPVFDEDQAVTSLDDVEEQSADDSSPWRDFLRELTRPRVTARAARAKRSPSSPGHEVYAKAEPRGSAAHFYLSGDRPRGWVSAEVSMMAKKRGFVRGSAVASLLVLVLLVVYTASLEAVLAFGVGSLTMLLLTPGLLAYLVARPDEHPLASTFLRSFRIVVLFTGLLPIAAAAALVARGGIDAPTSSVVPAFDVAGTAQRGELDLPTWRPRQAPVVPKHLEQTFFVLTGMAGLSTTCLMLSWIWPLKRLRTPFSASARDQSGVFTVIDPEVSETEDEYLRLSAEISAAHDDEVVLGRLREILANAELARDERDELVGRIDFYQRTAPATDPGEQPSPQS